MGVLYRHAKATNVLANGSSQCEKKVTDAPGVILKQAGVLESDLIIIGRHGQSPWEDMLVGSVTQQVIEESTCDVLIIEHDTSKPARRMM